MSRRQTLNPKLLVPPAIAGLILVASIVVGGITTRELPGRDDYLADVRDAIDDLPIRVGTWVGTDLETPPYVFPVLRPNKILQRRFFDPTKGRVISMLIVHCKDARDMEGHYPPVCYPGNGWVKTADAEVELDGPYHAARYEFTKPIDGAERGMTVLNFFVLPTGKLEVATRMDALYEAARSQARAGLGACQVQFLFYESGVPFEEHAEVANQFLNSIGPALERVAEGVDR